MPPLPRVRALLDEIIEHHGRRPPSRSLPLTGSSCNRPKGLEIGWVVPVPIAGSGGHNGIIRYANMLQKLGHNCTLYFDGGGRFTDFEHSPGSSARNALEPRPRSGLASTRSPTAMR